jgi:hypothetical protein
MSASLINNGAGPTWSQGAAPWKHLRKPFNISTNCIVERKLAFPNIAEVTMAVVH